MKKPNTKSMGQEFPWESHILPLPFPCLTATTNSRVCSNNPSFTLLWSLSSQQTIAWMLRKENGWGVTCMFDFPPCIISPPAEVQGETLWNRSADLVSFSSVAASSLVGRAHICPCLSPCWRKCDWLLELFWDVGGWTRNCCVLAAGTVCTEGTVAVCVTKAAVGSRVSC